MVYETDFYTTRRPYRATPSLSTYTITSEPSRQVRLLPGLGKVHVVHTYDRIVPYVGHKKLTVVTRAPTVIRVRPSTLYREYDRIENKLRPYTYHSYLNEYLNSDSSVRIVYVRNPIASSYPLYRTSTMYTTRYSPKYASYNYYPSYLNYYDYDYPYYYSSYPTRLYSFYPSHRWFDLSLYPSWRYNRFARIFNDETRAIKAHTAALMNRVHEPVPRKLRSLPLPYVSRYQEVPARISNDNYIHRMLLSSPSNKSESTVYYTDPVRKYFGQGHLACVTYAGEAAHPRRRNVYVYQDPVRHDIQLLSYYINKFKEEKALMVKSVKVILSPSRPSRIFSVPRPLEEPGESDEMKQLKEERAARLAKIKVIEEDVVVPKSKEEDDGAAKKKAEEAKRKADQEAAAKKAEQEAAKKRAEQEAAAKKAEQEAAAKKAQEEAAAKKAQEEAEKKKAEEEAAKKKAEEEAAKKKAEEEAARKKAEEEAAKKEQEAKEAAEKAAELERLAEQTRQEELAKQAEIEKAKQEEEERLRLEEEKRQAEAARAEEEKQQLLRLEEIARQAEEEKEAELVRQAEELAELARQEAELAEQAKKEEESVEAERREAEQAELQQKENELHELEQKEKELSELARQEAELAERARLEAEEAKKVVETEETAASDEVEPIVEEPITPEVEEAAAELQE